MQYTRRHKRTHRRTKRARRGGNQNEQIETKITFTIPAEIHKEQASKTHTITKPVTITRKIINLLRDMPKLIFNATGHGSRPLKWSEGNLELIGYHITTNAKLVTSCKRAIFEVEITVLTNSEVDTIEKATDIIYNIFPDISRDKYGRLSYSYNVYAPDEYLPYEFKPLDDPSNIHFQEDMYIFK